LCFSYHLWCQRRRRVIRIGIRLEEELWRHLRDLAEVERNERGRADLSGVIVRLIHEALVHRGACDDGPAGVGALSVRRGAGA
jgi:hypothetical protein